MKRASIGIALLLSGFLAGLVLTGRLRSASDLAASQTNRSAGTALAAPSSPSSIAAITGPAQGPPDFTVIAAQAVKGVVNISSVNLVRTPNSPWANDPMFQYFFGGQDDMFGSRPRAEMSLGSGVLISSDGYVVTNNHVVQSRNAEITVVFGDKHELPGKIIGTDPATDIALVKVAQASQPAVAWGDSSNLKVGQWVLAIGSPYQLNQTVTSGIVSALGRTNLGFSEYEDFIQTDAAINPGNSGGALVNMRGELIGINTGIYSTTQGGGYQGIGFAIPSNLARHVIDQLIQRGQVLRGSIGRMQLYQLTTQLATELGAHDTRGAFVNQIDRRSPAYSAGLRPTDVIVSFNGQTVQDPSHLVRLVADAKIGSSATVGVVRDGRQLTLKIPVVESQG
ncbi:MAG TPA: trypsin-like peptidase domain-containing protein [Vicinamibacterales bacterium]|nr:trypsin-like peptidase domain-containing protein [Vicinamibacterales bacterium]